MKVPNSTITASSSAHTGHPHAEWTRLARITVGDYVHPGKDARTPKLLTMNVVRVEAVESTGKGRARLTLADGLRLEAATGSKFWRVRADQLGPKATDAGVQLGAYRAAAEAVEPQRPTRGCTNCGGPVRTRKPEGWVCTRCARELNGPPVNSLRSLLP